MKTHSGKMTKIIAILSLVFFLIGCDTKKSPLNISQSLCYIAAACSDSQRGVKYGIIGDSWTDLVLGVPAIETIRVQLEKYHGYNLVGSTLGGQKLTTAYQTGLHYKTIDEAGPNIKYMLLSLGGNDLQLSPKSYVGRIQAEKETRFALIKNTLSDLIKTGNYYKIQKYGGAPLVWFIHGYDYGSPDNYNSASTTSCRTALKADGFTDTEVDGLVVTTFNEYNEMLKSTTYQEPQLRYIDLRGTLGGPPYSSKTEMWDCIHPTTPGFAKITTKYVQILQGYTGNDK